MAADKLHVDVVTIERSLVSAADVDRVVAPGAEGVMAILPHHEPMIAGLREGVLEIVRGDDREQILIFGGFLEVHGTRVIVMADVAEMADEIALERAEAARSRAENALREAPSQEDERAALAAMRRANLRIKTAKGRRASGSAGGSRG